MFKKILLSLIVFLFLGCVFYFLLNTPFALTAYLKHAITKNNPQIKIQKLEISQQKFSWPARFVIKNIVLKARQDETDMNVAVDQLQVRFPFLNAQGMNVKYGDWRITNVQADCQFDKENSQLNFYNLKGNFYGGNINGKGSLNFAPKSKVRADLVLKDVNPEALKTVNREAFSNIKGLLEGTVSLETLDGDVEKLAVNINAPLGGKIKAQLLNFVVQYIPEIEMKQRIESLSRKDQMIAFELAHFSLKSKDEHSLSGEFNLESKELNLNLNIYPEILIDGKIKALINSWQDILGK